MNEIGEIDKWVETKFGKSVEASLPFLMWIGLIGLIYITYNYFKGE